MSGSDFPFLTVTMCVPLGGAVMAAVLGRRNPTLAKQIGVLASLITLAFAIAAAVEFDSKGAAYQMVEDHNWIREFGVSYALGVDGVGMTMVLLTAVMMPILLVGGWNELEVGEHAQPEEAKGSAAMYVSLMLVLEAMAIGQFAALDVFFFYVLFEAMLIPVYFLIGRFGGPRRQYAAVKFLLYNLLGGLLMLTAVIWLYFEGPGGEKGYLLPNLIGHDFDQNTARWMFLGFMIAFAIKAPLWPFHTWLPEAAAESPPSNAVMLSAVLDKVGVFAMLHLALPLFPEAARYFAPLLIVMAVISIVYCALLAIGQKDMKRVIAYMSISHFGFIVLGIFAMTSQGQAGSTLFMVNHAFATAGMFLTAGFLMSRRGSRMVAHYGGVQKVAPMLAGCFLLFGLANLGLPGLSTFVSEFMILLGTFTRYPVAGLIASIAVLLAAIYVLLMYQRVMTGELTPETEDTPDLKPREILVMTPLIAAIVALGFFPKPVLDYINPSIDRTLTQVQRVDPSPDHPPTAPRELAGSLPVSAEGKPVTAEVGNR
ncbi:MAG: NADH-quinone oxidoreductase subunit M [Sporichthyaceae bacterium]